MGDQCQLPATVLSQAGVVSGPFTGLIGTKGLKFRIRIQGVGFRVWNLV